MWPGSHQSTPGGGHGAALPAQGYSQDWPVHTVQYRPWPGGVTTFVGLRIPLSGMFHSTGSDGLEAC